MPPTSKIDGAHVTVGVTVEGMDVEQSELEKAETIIRNNTRKTTVMFHPTMLGLSAPFTTVQEQEEEGGDDGERRGRTGNPI